MKYMLLFYADEAEWMRLPADDLQAAIAAIGAWYGELAGSGRIVTGGRLREAAAGRHVRLGAAGKRGRPMVADGPFMEAKESIGSYCVVEVEDIDEATAIAGSWPGGGAVEIRPLQEE